MSVELLETRSNSAGEPTAYAAGRRRVMHVLPIGHLGGGPETVRLIAQYLNRDRFEVCVVGPPSPILDRMAQISNLKRFALSFPTVPSLSTVKQLAKLIRQEHVDILHTHLFHGDLYGFLATRLAPVPLLVSTIQGVNFFWETERFPRRAAWWFLAYAYRVIYHWFDGMVACSQATKRAVCSRPGLKVNPTRVRVIHNTIDVEQTRLDSAQTTRILATSESDGPKPDKRIVTVANFDPVKGHRLLLEAIRRLHRELSCQWLLIGDGPERGALEAQARDMGLAQTVHFLGYRDDVPALVRGSDLFVFPSLWDGLGMAVLEAMALGVPVVACAAGGVPEIIADEENGVLVKPGDPEALIHAIRRVLSNPSFAARLIRRAQETVQEHFDARTMVRAYESWYDDLIAASVPCAP